MILRKDAEGPLPRRAAWAVAVVATLVMSVSYIDRQALAALAPTVRIQLAIDAEQYGWLAAAFSMAYLFAAPLAGLLVDRIGARIGLALAVIGWSIVSGVHATASSFAILFALRIALGVTEAPSFPGAAQTVRRVLSSGDRSTGFGLLFTGSSIGAMIAAPLAIALNTRYGWRFAFIGTALVGLGWVPLWLFTTRRPAMRALLGGSRAARSSSDATAVRVALLGSAPVLRALLLVLASSPSIMFVFLWYPQYLVDAHGITQAGLARYLWLPPLVFDLGAVSFGAMASRRDRAAGDAIVTHWPIMGLAALLCSSIALVPLAGSAWGATLVASACLAGGGAMFALLTADMLARVDPSRTSAAGGLTASAQSLAYVIASPLVGRVVKATHSYDHILMVLGALVLPGALAWALWPMDQASRDSPSASSAT
jgi:ACS family hexuronate transporter-like MFS transporter